MELNDPQAAAAHLATELPDDAQRVGAEPGAAPDGDAPATPAAPVIPEAVLLAELRAIVQTVDVLATAAFGRTFALSPEERERIAHAWLPWAIEQDGVPGVPSWVPGALVTATVYGPRVRATLAARKAERAQRPTRGEAPNEDVDDAA